MVICVWSAPCGLLIKWKNHDNARYERFKWSFDWSAWFGKNPINDVLTSAGVSNDVKYNEYEKFGAWVFGMYFNFDINTNSWVGVKKDDVKISG